MARQIIGTLFLGLWLSTLWLAGCSLGPEEGRLNSISPVSAPLPVGAGGEEGGLAPLEHLTRRSQAPYTYREARYWTLADGCTYSPAPAREGGWRWYLVANPLARGRPMVHEHCSFVFSAPP